MKASAIVVRKPGYNHPDWCADVACGCGAELTVKKEHLFIAHVHDMGGARDEVHFRCPCCGRANALRQNNGGAFENLPKQDDWLKENELTLEQPRNDMNERPPRW